MSEQQVGWLVDNAGVTLDIDDEHMVSDVLVVAKVVDSDGNVSIAIGTSESMDWITQLGLVEGARNVIRDPAEA